MNYELVNDKVEFFDWMIEIKRLGKKVAHDYYRLLLIEIDILPNIGKILSNKKGFIDLITKIYEYGNGTSVTITKKKAYVLVETLGSFVKKYGECKFPEMTDSYNKQVTFKYE